MPGGDITRAAACWKTADQLRSPFVQCRAVRFVVREASVNATSDHLGE
ncbi:MAG TPA: hypothetical protein VLN08_11915 [Vicinamibacterales bacterium]|nr:hypothetical protein [Vicinamibacterales bacterium]